MAQFLSPALKLSSTEQSVYTAPATGAIVIGLAASHTAEQDGTFEVDVWIDRGGSEIQILGKSSQVFPRTSLTLGTGKIVLENGDIIKARAVSANGGATQSVDLIVSIMEF